MREIKLAVCDIDDTLTQKNHLFPFFLTPVLARVKQQGVQFTLATGRMPYKARAVIEALDISLPVIANNGSILFHNGKMLYADYLDAAACGPVIQKYMQKDPRLTVIFSYEDRECPLQETAWINERKHKYKGYDQILGNTSRVWNQRVHKIYLVDAAKTGLIGRVAEELNRTGVRCSFFQYGEYSMEIVAPGCSKAKGVKMLADRLHIPMEKVMTIGDHTNDIEMTRAAGIGVAVANSDAKLKAAADYITRAPRAAGVKEALCKFILNEPV